MASSCRPLCFALISVAVFGAVLGAVKIPPFYDVHTGKLKNFGTREDETILPAWLAMTGVGYIVYVMASASE